MTDPVDVSEGRPEDGGDDEARSDALIRRFREGDRTAIDALIRRSEPALARLVRARLHGGQRQQLGAETVDVVQSALGEAVRQLDRFEYRGEGSFLRWLMSIAQNKLRHNVRDRRREKRDVAREQPLAAGSSSAAAIDPPSSDPSPSMAAAGIEMEERYRLALEALDPSEQELLLMHLELGCTNEEIAAALSISSVEAARKRVARAVAKLERRMLGSG